MSAAHRPLRICFVAYRGNMQCGGQGVYLWFLARELCRQGHQVDVIVGPPYPDPMPFAGRVERVENEMFWAKWFLKDWNHFLPEPPLRIFQPLHFYELLASRLGFLPEPFAFSWRAFRAVGEALRAGHRYDLVHDVQCLGYGLLGVRALGLPVVTTVHHPLSVDRRASFARDETLVDAIGSAQFYPIGLQSFVARRLDRVFTSSVASAGEIRRDFRVRPERLAMVANGLDTELFSPDPAQPRNPREILCVGRASDPNKGIRCLVEALAQLPPDVSLTLVDSPQSEAAKWAGQLGCGDRLRLAGRVETDELVRLYRRAALVVVPSRYEGFGLPAAEAMACGTPVVASEAGALPEVVTTGGGGVLVPRDDPETLAGAVLALLGDAGRRAELSARGRAGIQQAFSWPGVARRTVAEYRAVLRERASRSAQAPPEPASELIGSGAAPRRSDQHHHVRERGKAPGQGIESAQQSAAERRRQALDQTGPPGQPPGHRDAGHALQLQVATGLLAHQVQVVAGEVIGRNVVVTASTLHLPAQQLLSQRVGPARDAAGEGLEVGDGQHHLASRPRHPGHLGHGPLRTVEVVDRSLAVGRIEAVVDKGQGVGPTSHPAGGAVVRRLGRLESRPGGHPRRGLGAHQLRAGFCLEGQGVLPETARHVEHPEPPCGCGRP
jgi:glycosyltransferase involved in cell wall biosynthesis